MNPKTVVYSDRTEYHFGTNLHREDGPAIEYKNGNRHWYKNGLRHRSDGPAVVRARGGEEWWLNGLQHRPDGPAAEYDDGTKEWWVNGKLHRSDGPAIEYYEDDYDNNEWFINGNRLTKKIKEWFEETGFNRNHTTWTPQEKLLFKLKWY